MRDVRAASYGPVVELPSEDVAGFWRLRERCGEPNRFTGETHRDRLALRNAVTRYGDRHTGRRRTDRARVAVDGYGRRAYRRPQRVLRGCCHAKRAWHRISVRSESTAPRDRSSAVAEIPRQRLAVGIGDVIHAGNAERLESYLLTNDARASRPIAQRLCPVEEESDLARAAGRRTERE